MRTTGPVPGGRPRLAALGRGVLGRFGVAVASLALLAAGIVGCVEWAQRDVLPEGLVQANGRIEGDRIVVASKVAGRVHELRAREGDAVRAGRNPRRPRRRAGRGARGQARAAVDQATEQLGQAEAAAEEARAALARSRVAVAQARARGAGAPGAHHEGRAHPGRAHRHLGAAPRDRRGGGDGGGRPRPGALGAGAGRGGRGADAPRCRALGIAGRPGPHRAPARRAGHSGLDQRAQRRGGRAQRGRAGRAARRRRRPRAGPGPGPGEWPQCPRVRARPRR